MNAVPSSPYLIAVIAFVGFLAMFTPQAHAQSPTAKQIVPYIQERLHLDDDQVRAGLGVLLVYARERLPKAQFQQLARRMPNAELLLQQTHLRGIVTGPLDDEEEYERALTQLNIAPPLAARFASVVTDYLGAAGYYEEQGVLSRVFD